MRARPLVRTSSAVAACALIVAVAFALYRPVQRALFISRAERATGLTLDVERIDGGGGAYRLTNVRAQTRGGAMLLRTPGARVTNGEEGLHVTLDRPEFVVALDRMRGDEVTRTSEATAQWSDKHLTFARGTVTFVRGEIPEPVVTCDAVAVSLSAQSARVAYDLAANVRANGAAYPFESHTLARADGSVVQTWNAPLLPVAVLTSLTATSEAPPPSGLLRDVAIEAGTAVRGSAGLEDVAFTLGTHRIASIHGKLQVDGNGVGAKLLSGVLDGAVHIDASGEVHDLPGGLTRLGDGSNDLRALARLVTRIAGEPRLRSVHIEATAPGLAFGQYALQTDHGPLVISMLSADPAEPTLSIDTAIAQDHVVSGGERTSAMGVRTHAVAGVNGDYFDIGRTYQPQGMLVQSGSVVRGPTDRAALVIDRAHRVTFSEFHLTGSVKTNRGKMPVTLFNDWPPGDVAVITPAYGALRPSTSATFVSLAPVDSGGKRFVVTALALPGTTPPIGFGIAIGTLVHVPLPRIGDILELSYHFDPPLGDAVAGIGGGPILLRDGEWYEDPHAPAPDERLYRWPVLALAREADDRLLLVAVDGRHPERSVGATRPEFAALLQRLGAVDAMALDSGGSVTLVSRAPGDANVSVRNVPSDNSAERWISDALFFYSTAPSPSIVPLTQAPTPAAEARPTP